MIKFKVAGTDNKEYPFSVQRWDSFDNGQTYTYAGYGKFCKTIDEVDEYIQENMEESK